MNTFIKILVFIIVTTVSAEYLLNRQSSWLLFFLFVAIEIALIYFLVLPLIKKHLKP